MLLGVQLTLLALIAGALDHLGIGAVLVAVGTFFVVGGYRFD